MVQNHLLQILANLTMEPPAGIDSESVRDEKVKVLKEIARSAPTAWSAGSSSATARRRGWRRDSKVETFAALRLGINSWRWQGVPFYIRAGKELAGDLHRGPRPVPRRPPAVYSADAAAAELSALPHQPRREIALGVMVKVPGEEMADGAELLAFHHPVTDEMDAYERLLGDAMKGDATLFAREDYVEEAWRIVDPVLKAGTPVYEYEPNTWGPQRGRSESLTRWRVAQPHRGR